MRRAAPPTLRVDQTASPPLARVAPGPRGLRLERAEVRGAVVDPIHELCPAAGAPFRAERVEVVSGGRMALVAAPGIVASVSVPDMRVVHDRRPPGLDAIVGAADANAGLARVEGRWRALVLPSLGDLVTDIGPGPAAIRRDGRMVAALDDGRIVQRSLPEGTTIEEAGGPADAICVAADGAPVIAVGDAVGPPGTPAGHGTPIVALRAASGAARAASLDAAGEVVVWNTDAAAPISRFGSPRPDLELTGMSPEGDLVVLAGSEDPVAALLRVSTGRVAAWFEGARDAAVLPDDKGIVIVGDFGVVHLTRPREVS